MRRIFLAIIGLALCLAALLPAPRAHATACTAGCTQYVAGSVSSGSTLTVSVPSVVAGHGLRIWWHFEGATALSSVTVNLSAATIGTTTAAASGATWGVARFANAPAGTNSVVLTFTGTCTACSANVEEWPGDDPVGTGFDGQNATGAFYSGGASMPCGSISPVNSGDTVEAFLVSYDWSAQGGVPSGYSTVFNTLTSNGLESTYLTSASSGAQNPTYVASATAQTRFVICAAFKQSGGGGPTLPAGSLMLMGVGK